jgi:threonine dehydrogenase-like Zn-dependent dehydrogenase
VVVICLLYGGYIPTVQPGDIIGHEFMGEVVDVGHAVSNLKIGDRINEALNLTYLSLAQEELNCTKPA